MACPLLLLPCLCHGLRFSWRRWELLQKLKPCYLLFLNFSRRNACSDHTTDSINPADIQIPGFDPAVPVSTLDSKNTHRWVEERDILGWGGVQFLAGEVSMDHSLPSATVATYKSQENNQNTRSKFSYKVHTGPAKWGQVIFPIGCQLHRSITLFSQTKLFFLNLRQVMLN